MVKKIRRSLAAIRQIPTTFSQKWYDCFGRIGEKQIMLKTRSQQCSF